MRTSPLVQTRFTRIVHEYTQNYFDLLFVYVDEEEPKPSVLVNPESV